MNKKYTGSCLCGEIVFEIMGDFDSFLLCHCERCRKDTGSAHAANLFSTTARLRWISGKDKIKIFMLESTRHMKSFCSDCGSALPYMLDDTQLVVPAGCLDSDVLMKPQAHIHFTSKVQWDNELENVLKFDQLPTDDKA